MELWDSAISDSELLEVCAVIEDQLMEEDGEEEFQITTDCNKLADVVPLLLIDIREIRAEFFQKYDLINTMWCAQPILSEDIKCMEEDLNSITDECPIVEEYVSLVESEQNYLSQLSVQKAEMVSVGEETSEAIRKLMEDLASFEDNAISLPQTDELWQPQQQDLEAMGDVKERKALKPKQVQKPKKTRNTNNTRKLLEPLHPITITISSNSKNQWAIQIQTSKEITSSDSLMSKTSPKPITPPQNNNISRVDPRSRKRPSQDQSELPSLPPPGNDVTKRSKSSQHSPVKPTVVDKPPSGDNTSHSPANRRQRRNVL